MVVRQYETLCSLLDKELQIAPMDETEAVYRQLVSGTDPALDPFVVLDRARLREAAQQVDRALDDLNDLHRRLESTRQLLEPFLSNSGRFNPLDVVARPKSD